MLSIAFAIATGSNINDEAEIYNLKITEAQKN
jgi:hypothetical protein